MSVDTSLYRDSFDSSPIFHREKRTENVTKSNFKSVFWRLNGKRVTSDKCEEGEDSILMKKWTIHWLELSSAISSVQNRAKSLCVCQV